MDIKLVDVKPLNTKILFKFVERVHSNAFHGKTKSGIEVIELPNNQLKQNRWGEVIATGPDIADEEISPGEYILIEALGWTEGLTLNVNDDIKFWFTDLKKIICVSDTIPDII
jgi:co-chaperonin GroES (HSP10)